MDRLRDQGAEGFFNSIVLAVHARSASTQISAIFPRTFLLAATGGPNRTSSRRRRSSKTPKRHAGVQDLSSRLQSLLHLPESVAPPNLRFCPRRVHINPFLRSLPLGLRFHGSWSCRRPTCAEREASPSHPLLSPPPITNAANVTRSRQSYATTGTASSPASQKASSG